MQGCSCDATVIEGGKRNGLKENAVRISASDIPPSRAFACQSQCRRMVAHAEIFLLKSDVYHTPDKDGSDLRMHCAVARATMFSRCTGAQFGGEIGNGGC